MISKPKVCIYWPDSVAKWVIPWLTAVERGFQKHGVTPEKSTYKSAKDNSNPNYDLAVFWSHRPKHIINRQLEAGKDYLVMERGYVGDRQAFTSMGFNGLNGYAQFYANNMSNDRWNKYFEHYMQNWRKDYGDYVLLIGQIQGDISIEGLNVRQWCQDICNQIKNIDSRIRVRFRQHPLELQRGTNWNINGAEWSNNSLIEDFDGARCCITYNSNTGVEAVLWGVPTVAIDQGSMAWNVVAHELDLNPPKPERAQWAHNMAYCQWTEAEIEAGEAWEHLKQRYE